MTPAPALRALALVLAVSGGAGSALLAAPAGDRGVLPVELIDVETGQPVQLEPGPKILHVVVFATWCRPCEDELTRLAEWEARFGAGGYRLAIVALAERQSRDRLLGFLKERRPPGRLYFDGSRKLEKALGVDGLPAHYLLDSEGRVRFTAGSLGEIGVATVEGMLGQRGTTPGTTR